VVTVTYSNVFGGTLGATVIVTGKLVAVPPEPIVAVTPGSLNVTAVAPLRQLPEIVADIVVPGNA
jgi:hypothetical protein